MKRLGIVGVMLAALLLAGCGPATKVGVRFDGLQVEISADYAAISSAQLDSYQIINKILKAYKDTTRTLIIARSSLTAKLNSDEYAQTSKEKIAQSMPGYTHIKDSTENFTCGDETIKGYVHQFSISPADETSGKIYIAQYYFIAQDTPYIISQADTSSAHYSAFTSLLSSLDCN